MLLIHKTENELITFIYDNTHTHIWVDNFHMIIHSLTSFKSKSLVTRGPKYWSHNNQLFVKNFHYSPLNIFYYNLAMRFGGYKNYCYLKEVVNLNLGFPNSKAEFLPTSAIYMKTNFWRAEVFGKPEKKLNSNWERIWKKWGQNQKKLMEGNRNKIQSIRPN